MKAQLITTQRSALTPLVVAGVVLAGTATGITIAAAAMQALRWAYPAKTLVVSMMM